MNVTENEVIKSMMILMNMEETNIKNKFTINRCIRNHFGIEAAVVLCVWKLLYKQYNELPTCMRIKHLLWMFSYFKSYGEYEQYCTRYKCAANTFRSWVWYLAKLVAELDIVSIYMYFFLNCYHY
jgi:hypothetical protein